MGNLAVRKVIYNGKKYYFESPYLKDGIVILEGINGHGKSTFMNLIYYGLGGKVSGFNRNGKSVNKHKEIYNDEDNYVELQVEINNKKYVFRRAIGDNVIFIADEDKRITETCVFRMQNNQHKKVFSDWLLSILDINVFDIIQGTRSFKLNFSDLMRLIYYDQSTEVDKIYKEPDNSNFLSDSLEIRKAIFEVLLGKTYDKYYLELGNYKLKLKELEKIQAIMDSYDDFLNEILSDDLSNVHHINDLIIKNKNRIKKINIERNIAINEKNNSTESLKYVDEQRNILVKYQSEIDDLSEEKKAINQSIDKIIFLIDEAERELREIEKVRFANKKLKLFSPNTCPYCLREVKRAKGKCICGGDVDEEQYEKFFYTDNEYFQILKVKNKAINSLKNLLDRKNCKIKNINSEIVELDNKILNIKKYINELMENITFDYNSAYIRQLDNEECELNAKVIELQQAKQLAEKRENIGSKLIKLGKQVKLLQVKTEKYLNIAKEDMLKRKNNFSDIYLKLMKLADNHCYAAYIGDDYMPNINFSQYRERSASVPKRLMFFLTILIESLQNEVNFPRFLMIDTPNKEGIDKENLIKNIELLSKADEVKKKANLKYQIILTTGINTYPDKYKDLVFLKLDHQKYLLKEKK